MSPLRALTRASLTRASLSPATLLVRANTRANSTATPAAPASHAIATPLISNLPARWESLPVEEQVDLTVKIWERQKLSWSELTQDEKRASFYISYGPWGPRKPMHEPYDNYKILGGTIIGLAASVAAFAFARSFGGPEPVSLNRQWQEATDERFNTGLVEPFRGKWSQVQSKPAVEVDDE
ncbi:uncharacterized protein V2V93DRAFT_375947 [Kockiozyma suomiensis]|uniref:uncharacterized protein n=1 Tax=Kockiozyma suomiensis TaxID=1337062 RepID=UPI00334412DA